MSELFVKATREQWRFESNRGLLTTEQLWELPLSSKSNFDLDNVAKTLSKKIKDLGEEASFVTERADIGKNALEDQLELVKSIISVKKAESAAMVLKKENADKKARIKEILSGRSEDALKSKTNEELLAELANL